MKTYLPLCDLLKEPTNKHIHDTAQLFIKMCIDEAEVRKKPYTTTLFALKNFLKKQPLESIHVLYDYLYSLDEPVLMDLGTAFRNASEYQQKIRLETDRKLQPTVEEYRDYKECLKELMN